MENDRIAVVGERELALGFKLIGISDVFTAEGNDAVDVVNKVIKEKEYGLVLVSESIKKYINASTAKRFESSLKPLVIFIPLKEMEGKKETLEQIAKRVLGIDLGNIKLANR